MDAYVPQCAGMGSLVDTHCHLDVAEFAADRDAVVDAARAAGVKQIVVPAIAAATFSDVQQTCQRYAAAVAAYGLHPVYLEDHRLEDLDVLDQWLIAERPLAVGEIGLDFFVEGLDVQRQEDLFSAQLKLARTHQLPVLLHVRRAQDAILKWLRRIEVPGGIAHAFNGSMQQAEQYIALGFKLGFGGAMTYARALNLRRLAVALPLEAIVLETDAPDIAPEWISGQRNDPSQLQRIAQVLADLRGIPVAEVMAQTTANAHAVLPRLVA